MIFLIPVGILVLLAVLLQFLGRFRLSIGRTWILAAVTSISTWVFMIVIRYLDPPASLVNNWLPLPENSSSLTFSFSPETWTYSFLAITLLVVVILADARFIEKPGYLRMVTGSILITGIGLLAIQSGSWLALALTWGILDLTELVLLMLEDNDRDTHRQVILLFLSKSLGTILFVGLMTSLDRSANPDWTIITWLIIVVIALLRSGVLVTRYLNQKWKDLQRGSWMIMRMIPFLSIFSFLGIVGNEMLPQGGMTFLTTILIFGSLFCSIFWFLSKSVVKGNPYWMTGSIFFALICVFNGQMNLLKSVGIFSAVGWGGVFLSTYRFRKQNFFIIILIIGLIGIPFSPTSNLRTLTVESVPPALLILLIPSLAIFVGGIARHSLIKEEPHGKPEAWTKFVYYIALAIILISPWIMMVFTIHEVRTLEKWWVAVAVAGLILLVLLPYTSIGKIFGLKSSYISTFRHKAFPILHYVESDNRFSWFGKVVTIVQNFLSTVINLSIRVLEGDGGILWSFFFLVLLVSLIRSIGVR